MLFLKNLVLSILTLGIYSFWGQVEQKRFLYQNMTFQGKHFDYTGTGKEKFIGFIKALLLLIVVGFIINILANVMGFMAFVLFYLFLFAFIPIIIYQAQRYALSRTRLNNMPFALVGDQNEFAKLNYKMIFLCIITLGIATPWYIIAQHKYLTSKTQYGQVEFDFEGKAGDLFVCFIVGYLLSIVTLGIYLPWFIESLNAFYINNTRINGSLAHYNKSGFDYFILLLVSLLMLVFSLGLAAPWVIIRNVKYFCERFHYSEEIPFDTLYSTASTQATAFGEEALSLFE
jgi:uncharacterized membrane protein YjgN (DUF898 family)